MFFPQRPRWERSFFTEACAIEKDTSEVGILMVGGCVRCDRFDDLALVAALAGRREPGDCFVPKEVLKPKMRVYDVLF